MLDTAEERASREEGETQRNGASENIRAAEMKVTLYAGTSGCSTCGKPARSDTYTLERDQT